MAKRPFILGVLVTVAMGCAAPEADVLRTGDPYARGYTDDDFPRIQELAEGVHPVRDRRRVLGRSCLCTGLRA